MVFRAFRKAQPEESGEENFAPALSSSLCDMRRRTSQGLLLRIMPDGRFGSIIFQLAKNTYTFLDSSLINRYNTTDTGCTNMYLIVVHSMSFTHEGREESVRN